MSVLTKLTNNFAREFSELILRSGAVTLYSGIWNFCALVKRSFLKDGEIIINERYNRYV